MDKITKELKVSGIYCIENVTNHKTYIGSSRISIKGKEKLGEGYIKKENLNGTSIQLLCMFMI